MIANIVTVTLIIAFVEVIVAHTSQKCSYYGIGVSYPSHTFDKSIMPSHLHVRYQNAMNNCSKINY